MGFIRELKALGGVLVLKRIKSKKEGMGRKKKKKLNKEACLTTPKSLCFQSHFFPFELWYLLTSKLVLSWSPFATNIVYTNEQVVCSSLIETLVISTLSLCIPQHGF